MPASVPSLSGGRACAALRSPSTRLAPRGLIMRLAPRGASERPADQQLEHQRVGCGGEAVADAELEVVGLQRPVEDDITGMRLARPPPEARKRAAAGVG